MFLRHSEGMAYLRSAEPETFFRPTRSFVIVIVSLSSHDAKWTSETFHLSCPGCKNPVITEILVPCHFLHGCVVPPSSASCSLFLRTSHTSCLVSFTCSSSVKYWDAGSCYWLSFSFAPHKHLMAPSMTHLLAFLRGYAMIRSSAFSLSAICISCIKKKRGHDATLPRSKLNTESQTLHSTVPSCLFVIEIHPTLQPCILPDVMYGRPCYIIVH